MRITIIVLLAFQLIVIGCKNAPAEVETTPAAQVSSAGQDLPAFQLINEKGEKLDLRSFAGKKVFVNIWASWCPPCRREMPSIQSLYNKVDASKTAFVMLTVDEEAGAAENFVRSNSITAPIYHPAEQLPSLLAVESIPATFIFDEKGKLIRRIDGMHNYDTEEFKNLLSGGQ